MGWKGFKRGLSELIQPPYLQGMSFEERRLRTRRRWRNSELFFFFQAAESPADHEQRRTVNDSKKERDERDRSDSPETGRR
jgi:hypothetical protein